MFFPNRNSQWRLQLLSVLPVGLMLLVAGALASKADDGLGKADAQPATLDVRIQSTFEVAGTPLERYQRALETVKLVNQHLLIVFGQPGDSRIASLMKLRFEDPEFRPYSDEFRFMAIPTDAPRLDSAVALAEHRFEQLTEARRPFHLVICDATGKKVASAGIEEL